MKIGLISDTHNGIAQIKKAASLLIKANVSAVLHCGDICSRSDLEELYSELYSHQIPLFFVLGNCDFASAELCNYPHLEGLRMCGRFGEVEFSNRKIAFLHGDDSAKLAQAISSEKFDYIVTGHTHITHDKRVGKTRLLNPGSTTKSRRGHNSCAVLDLDQDDFQLIFIF